MQKSERQEKILDIIRGNQINTQDLLISMLEADGFSVNQSSVSRDLEELGILKSNGYYAIPQKTQDESFGLRMLEIAGENLIVAKCEAGLASAVCVRIDRENFSEIVGTIAGDDTIFIAVRNHKEQKTVLKKVWEIFEKKL